MKEIDRTKPVLVTGATGYVAGRVIEKLLAEGLTVHAAVRNPGDSQKLQHLNALADQSEGTIRYFKSDLLDEGSYADAMESCELVFHTASPFVTHVEDPQKELINPALLGTRNVLEQANKTPSVKRVVVTSSCAAIYGDNADLKKTPNGVFTEEDWNTSSSLSHGAYSYSKTLAEREAWEIAGKQDQWELVTINPSLVIGPGINPRATSESFNIIKQLGDGTMKTGVPDIGFGVVDVRDLAIAHYKFGFIKALIMLIEAVRREVPGAFTSRQTLQRGCRVPNRIFILRNARLMNRNRDIGKVETVSFKSALSSCRC